MAFSKGKESINIAPAKKYIGMGAVNVVALNPSKEELEALRGFPIDREISYLSKMQSEDGREIETIRLDIYTKTTNDEINFVDGKQVNINVPLTIYLKNQKVYGRTSGKYQVVDKYGRFAWLDRETLEAHTVPSNIRLDPGYRQAYVGEEDLTKFCKALIGVEEMGYVDKDGQYHANPNPEKCEARLEHVAEYFTGDLSELKNIFALQPNNKCKVMFGVKEDAARNRSYQVIYPHHFLKFGNNRYSSMEKNLDNNMPYIKDTVYQVCSLKEYTMQPTSFETPATTQQAPQTPEMIDW